MAAAKLQIVNEGKLIEILYYVNGFCLDLLRQKYRYGIKGDMNPHHQPQRTLHAMRVLAGIEDQENRINLSKAFYKVSSPTGHT